jgi:hypothetical protein
MKNHSIFIVLTTAILSVQAITPVDKHEYIFGKNIKSGSAKQVKAAIEILVGELIIGTGNISYLLQAECRYSQPEWEPETNYVIQGENGNLSISNRQMKGQINYDEEDQSKWKLQFDKELQIEYTVFLGAGESKLKFKDSNIKKLDFEMKAGEAEIDLRNTSIPLFNFKALAGEVLIDLSGEWKNDLNAYIKGGVGDLTIILPANYDIGMEISGLLGEIDAPGFHKDGKDYYRNTEGSGPMLYLEVHGGIGNVSVQLAE